MILMIDNYDSFTYNLVQYMQMLHQQVEVVRNDACSVAEALAAAPAAIIISPGPGNPDEAGISVELIRAAAGKVPLLGVCLGHQCIGAAYGGRIVRAGRIMHGKASAITHDGEQLFAGLKSPFSAIRYHSLVVERQSLPDCLQISATSEDGEIMAMQHRQLLVHGVQFHPESILTTSGKRILANFLRLAGISAA